MLLSRQKLILTLLANFGGKSSATDFQKYLFLFTQLCEKEKSFDFIPYKFGCFSFQSMADKRKLVEKGYLKDSNEWELTSNLSTSAIQCEKDKADKILKFCLKFKTVKGKRLIQHVYKSYPYYAINSEIAAEHLTDSELTAISAARPIKKRTPAFCTIGYEGSSIEAYINKLIKNDINILIDVRKNPISRKYGFSKNTLSSLLEKVGIEYMHMPSLGIESSERQELSSQSDYDLLFDKYEADILSKESQSLNSLYEIFLNKKRIAITCFEKEHCQCHRSRVANSIKSISKNTIEIQHL